MKSWQSLSSSMVATPSRTCGVMKSRVSAASRPALRMAANSSGPCSLMRRASPCHSLGVSCREFITAIKSPEGQFARPPSIPVKASDGELLGYIDACRPNAAGICHHLNAGRLRLSQCCFICGVDVACDCQLLAIVALGEEQHHRPGTGLAHGDEFAQMARATRRDRVGKLGRGTPLQRDALHLDIAGRAVFAF